MTGTAVYCDCCGREKLGEIHPGENIEIIDGRHGTKHHVRLSPAEVFRRISGTESREGIVAFIHRIL